MFSSSSSDYDYYNNILADRVSTRKYVSRNNAFPSTLGHPLIYYAQLDINEPDGSPDGKRQKYKQNIDSSLVEEIIIKYHDFTLNYTNIQNKTHMPRGFNTSVLCVPIKNRTVRMTYRSAFCRNFHHPFKRKTSNSNCFTKAFQWYTKDHGQKRTSCKPNTGDMKDFVMWLDDKYDEYIQDHQMCKQAQILIKQTSTRNINDSLNTYTLPEQLPSKKIKRLKSPWKKRQKIFTRDEKGDVSLKYNQSIEVILKPKNNLHPASECCGSNNPCGGECEIRKSKSLMSILREKEIHIMPFEYSEEICCKQGTHVWHDDKNSEKLGDKHVYTGIQKQKSDQHIQDAKNIKHKQSVSCECLVVSPPKKTISVQYDIGCECKEPLKDCYDSASVATCTLKDANLWTNDKGNEKHGDKPVNKHHDTKSRKQNNDQKQPKSEMTKDINSKQNVSCQCSEITPPKKNMSTQFDDKCESREQFLQPCFYSDRPSVAKYAQKFSNTKETQAQCKYQKPTPEACCDLPECKRTGNAIPIVVARNKCCQPLPLHETIQTSDHSLIFECPLFMKIISQHKLNTQ